MDTNRITTARGSLGVKLTDTDHHCSCCTRNDAWIQINIDGVWSYLCTQCWARFTSYVVNPLRA